MRNAKTGGFTLIELLIVIAIIGILAAVLIPNLLNARKRAFDTAAQTCLKEVATQEEVYASNSPFEYNTGYTAADIPGCNNGHITLTSTYTTDKKSFAYTALDDRGTTTYKISAGTGVTPN